MANDFIYSQPVKIIFGEGRIRGLGGILKEAGISRCMLLCDRFLRGRAEELAAEIPEICGVFSDIEENPQIKGVNEAAFLTRAYGAEAVAAMGGGSTMDTAKFAAAIACESDNALPYFRGEKRFPAKRLTVIAIPTTAGTGSEVTQVSVTSCGKEKKTINDPVFMPGMALIDPELTYSVPKRTTMNTGLDALAHALEGYWSRGHQPISDLMAKEAVRLVLGNLESAWRNGEDREARRNMSMAALLGGLSFAMPKTAGCHACSYPLSEDYHLPHGEACAFTLSAFVRINSDERLDALAKEAGLSGTEELAERIDELKEMAGLRTRLSDLPDPDIDKLSRDCAAHPLMRNNPVEMTAESLKEMFETLK